jgi:hypothetical protein
MPRIGHFIFILCVACITVTSAQEQTDRVTTHSELATSIAQFTVRVRVTHSEPACELVQIGWSSGGHGLGGQNAKGAFRNPTGSAEIKTGEWSARVGLAELAGTATEWAFPNISVHPGGGQRKNRRARRNPAGCTNVTVEFEFAQSGLVVKSFTEPAPRGATVTFAIPLSKLNASQFSDGLQGLSSYVRHRRENTEKLFSVAAPLPREFAVLGHLAGYGEGVEIGKGGGAGYGVRHGNPAILQDECTTLELLGINGMVGGRDLADKAAFTNQFRRMYWGGPWSGSPVQNVKRRSGDACPFDPAIKASMQNRVAVAIEEHRAAHARESWALWDDEIGVYIKEHPLTCLRCQQEFRNYLRQQRVKPSDLGRNSWQEVLPYKIFDTAKPGINRRGQKKEGPLAEVPGNAADALRYYYTFRFMTYATAKVFPEAAREFQAAGIRLYAMQGPTPSWAGSSLDWHEFYDLGANTAIVFETSNRDPQIWQFESYLADMARGIAQRHQMSFGCLVKPHRGAPQQRMLAVIARGATALEWYTYGPDYAKGDSFSQRAELIEAVGRADRFLGRAEPFLYGAQSAQPAEVAFVSPRSSEIWGKATSLGVTAFEDAKWVYLALRHEHIPVDILSEQQVADDNLNRYKAIYIPGPNLHHAAAAAVKEWVRNGGSLWTDALGLSRDEANQPSSLLVEMAGLSDRRQEFWGSVSPYRAINLQPFAETNRSKIFVQTEQGRFEVSVGREVLPKNPRSPGAFSPDGSPALLQSAFGRGSVTVAGFFAGLSYSTRVRRSDFNMAADFNPDLRALIAQPALARHIQRPAVPASALVEAISLKNQQYRCIALINWNYRRQSGSETLQPAENLEIDLSGSVALHAVRSVQCGPLSLIGHKVILPVLATIDLLILE